jgi:hypothetical protein
MIKILYHMKKNYLNLSNNLQEIYNKPCKLWDGINTKSQAWPLIAHLLLLMSEFLAPKFPLFNVSPRRSENGYLMVKPGGPLLALS